MSYTNLPVHLRPCFLYIGVFREDEKILISRFILLLVAKGLVKPIDGKSLEEVAEEYVEELVGRNLLIVEKRRHCGKLKSFNMHDLLRDVSLREAQKLMFLCVLGEHSIPQDINDQRRIRSTLWVYPTPLIHSLESALLVRSFIGERPKSLSNSSRLLRLSLFDGYYEGEDNHYCYKEIFHGLVNLRFIVVNVEKDPLPRIPSSLVSFLWNLQIIDLYFLIITQDYVFEIGKVPLLRHVMTNRGTLDGAHCLPDSENDKEDFVLENLQTLYEVSNLTVSDGVLRRIPNIKKMKLYYGVEGDDYRLYNLCYLHRLETLRLCCSKQHTHMIRQVSRFPYSLKKLTLQNTYLPWEDMKTKIGLLPLLQVLKLKQNSFIGSKWETFEDHFSNLKFLLIESCDVERWMTDDAHFPCLEHLVLCFMYELREIPSCLGYIPTLHSIKLESCSDSVEDSAQKIKEEQREVGNEDLHIMAT